MSANIFLDSNILLYVYSENEPHKRKIAQNLVTENNAFISTQVLQELSSIFLKKFKLSHKKVLSAIKELTQSHTVSVNDHNTIMAACRISERYKYSFYDSLIIAAALENGCKILYSEDLQDGQTINSKMIIKNPFH